MTRELVDLELLVIPRCPHAEPAEQLLRSALRAAGLHAARVRVTVIDSQREAERRRFLGSPTILVNGVDPFAEPGHPPALACRVYLGPAGPSGLPTIDDLTKVLRNSSGQGEDRRHDANQ